MRFPVFIVCVLVCIALPGCAARETVDVSGAIAWDGAPMPHGDIMFVDVDPRVPAAAGKIVNGLYKFTCKPGEKRVQIQSYRLSGKKTPQGTPIGEMYVPARFSSETELKVNVTLEGDNKFDFDLKP